VPRATQNSTKVKIANLFSTGSFRPPQPTKILPATDSAERIASMPREDYFSKLEGDTSLTLKKIDANFDSQSQSDEILPTFCEKEKDGALPVHPSFPTAPVPIENKELGKTFYTIRQMKCSEAKTLSAKNPSDTCPSYTFPRKESSNTGGIKFRVSGLEDSSDVETNIVAHGARNSKHTRNTGKWLITENFQDTSNSEDNATEKRGVSDCCSYKKKTNTFHENSMSVGEFPSSRKYRNPTEKIFKDSKFQCQPPLKVDNEHSISCTNTKHKSSNFEAALTPGTLCLRSKTDPSRLDMRRTDAENKSLRCVSSAGKTTTSCATWPGNEIFRGHEGFSQVSTFSDVENQKNDFGNLKPTHEACEFLNVCAIKTHKKQKGISALESENLARKNGYSQLEEFGKVKEEPSVKSHTAGNAAKTFAQKSSCPEQLFQHIGENSTPSSENIDFREGHESPAVPVNEPQRPRDFVEKTRRICISCWKYDDQHPWYLWSGKGTAWLVRLLSILIVSLNQVLDYAMQTWRGGHHVHCRNSW